MLGKLTVPGRPTSLDDSRARAYCACSRCGWGCLDIFSLIYLFSFLSPSLWETARYRLKYCLKGPLSPKQPTDQPIALLPLFLFRQVLISSPIQSFFAFSLLSECSCLLPCILLLLLLHTAFFQISPLITDVKNISGNQRLFPATFLPKYLTGYISHCCIEGGNYGIDAHVLSSQSNEWCELPIYRRSKSASYIWVPQLLKIKP